MSLCLRRQKTLRCGIFKQKKTQWERYNEKKGAWVCFKHSYISCRIQEQRAVSCSYATGKTEVEKMTVEEFIFFPKIFQIKTFGPNKYFLPFSPLNFWNSSFI